MKKAWKLVTLLLLLLLVLGCDFSSRRPSLDSVSADLLELALQFETWDRPRRNEAFQQLDAGLDAHSAQDIAQSLLDLTEKRGLDWAEITDCALVVLGPWVLAYGPEAGLSRLMENPLVKEAAAGAQPYLSGPASEGLGEAAAARFRSPEPRADETALLQLAYVEARNPNSDASLQASLCHLTNRLLEYGDLALIPEDTLVSMALIAGQPTKEPGVAYRCQQAAEKLGTALVKDPMNHFRQVTGEWFRSASSVYLHVSGVSAERFLHDAIAALLATNWEQWWGFSKMGPILGHPGGGIEFDFWPLVIDGIGPTKVRLELSPAVEVLRPGRSWQRLQVHFRDDGKSQMVGDAYWLLQAEEGRQRDVHLLIHSVFEPGVRLAANYQTDWKEIRYATLETVNFTDVVSRMHVWDEDDEGPVAFLERMDVRFHAFFAALEGGIKTPDKARKSGLAGLVEYLNTETAQAALRKDEG